MKAAERERRQRADREREQRHAAGDERGVEKRLAEELGLEGLLEVVERRTVGDVLQRAREEIALGGERAAQRPGEGEERVDEDDDHEEVERHPFERSSERATPEHAAPADRANDGPCCLAGGAHRIATRWKVR